MGFGAGGLTSRPSPGISSTFGVGSVLGLISAPFSYLPRPAHALLSPEPWGGQGNLATHVQWHRTVCYLFYLFIYYLFVRFVVHFQLGTYPLSRDCR